MKFIADLSTYKYILRIALPAIAGLSTQMLVSLVDTAMVGRLEEAEASLAAMGLGVLATWAFIAFFSSFATGTHVLTARRFGEKNYTRCGEVLNTSLIISLVTGIVVGAFISYTSYDFAKLISVDDKVAFFAGDYLHYRFMGLPFFLMTVSYRGFFFGIGKTKIFMYSGIMANVLNMVFNYIFIYGMFGIEGMGLAGAGLGSTLATICDSLFYLTVCSIPRYRLKYNYFKSIRYVKEIGNSILKISLPISFQNIFILLGFLGFVAISGLISTTAQAASQVIISAIQLSLFPCFGFGIAIQTLVGNSLGAGKINIAKYYGFETSKVATLYTIIIGIFLTLTPRIILAIVTNNHDVIEAAVPALRIAGVGQIFYGIGIVLANGLQASGQTLFVMIAEVIINWFLFIPIAYLLGVFWGMGLTGAWMALPFYVILYSITIFVKFKYGNWKNLKAV
ncbi:MAG: MATE family efflux transporter [Ignavibacteria bacterium]|jgi:putative MATE family efflux protein